MAEAGGYFLPTMAVFFAVAEHGKASNLPQNIIDKTNEVIREAISSLDRLREAGILSSGPSPFRVPEKALSHSCPTSEGG